MNLEELSKLYYHKYLKSITKDLHDISDYTESNPIERQDILSLYKLRNDSYKQEKGADNIQFKKFIICLQSCDESKLIMHVFQIKDQPHMIVTDVTYTKIIGEL